jgi:nicotinamidase-related amidase
VTADLKLEPAKTALLLMDFQPLNLGSIQDPDVLLESASIARTQAKVAGAQVGFVRVAFRPGDYDSISDRNKIFSGVRNAGRLADGSDEASFHSLLTPDPTDIVVRKTRVGAFSTTDLHERLQERGVDTVLLTGISTSGVVLSTVRDAADRDYRVVVLEDCCADGDPEVHRILTERVLSRQAHVLDSAALPSLFGAG